MKKVTWDHPNKMHFESSHKTFNRQTVCISTGNVWSTTQHSGYIRPYTEVVNPVGSAVPEGHLQNFDLAPFRDYWVHSSLLADVKKLTHEQTGILYLFKHYNGDHCILDGLVLTTGHDDGCHHIKTWFLNNDWRAQEAVCEARRYITSDFDKEEEEED